MSATRHETTAELIARRPERLNILITAGIGGADMHRAYYSVHVRYGWSQIAQADRRPVTINVPMLADRWDPSAPNRIGQPGAFVETPDPAGVREAVANLRAAWGPLHVQDNSGLVPDLHQGMWRE